MKSKIIIVRPYKDNYNDNNNYNNDNNNNNTLVRYIERCAL